MFYEIFETWKRPAICLIFLIIFFSIAKPNDLDASQYIEQANRDLHSGNYDEVILNCTMAIEIEPASSDAYFMRGLAYYELGKFDQAISDYSHTIRLNSNRADAYNNRGLAYEKKSNLRQAILDYRRALEIDPEHNAARKNLDRLKK